MAFNRFAVRLVLRVTLLTLALAGLSVALTTPGFYGTTLLLAAIAAVVLYELYNYVSRTNAELTRFLEAARYQDFGQRFGDAATAPGAGFERLNEAFGEVMQRFRIARRRQEESIRRLESLTEHIPVPLFSVHGDNSVQLHNNAARRLFGNNKVSRVEDLGVFGGQFVEAVKDLKPGERRLVSFSYDGVERQLTAVATQVVTATAREKLVSMQDIQSELDDAQLHAWRDMVRVLTHEIMNSVTPVASLAKTASELVDSARAVGSTDPDAALEALEDAHAAVDTVARRSDGLMQFVQSYRSLALQPTPQKQRLAVKEVFRRLEQFLSRRWEAAGIELTTQVEPDGLTLEADPGLLEQVLINLLTNAEQALEARDRPAVALSARLNRRGHVLIEVADNGPGIPAEMAKKIFVPFFTTRRGGTGVGLALTRQIIAAHGGSITAAASALGGARFTLIF